MKVIDGRIMEATRNELCDYYLKQRYYNIYPLDEFITAMKYCGVKIINPEKEKQPND